MRQVTRNFFLAVCALALLLVTPSAHAQGNAGSTTARPLIAQEISAQMQTISGHVRANLAGAQDLGAVPDSLPLSLYLVLQRSPEQQADLENLIARQQQPGAAEYHQWLTPQQFGQRFGAAQKDIATISAWLQSQGFQVNAVMNSGSFIDFSATAGQVRQVFGTQLHSFSIGGGVYPAAVTDPVVPAALAPAIAGIAGLTKIPMHTNVKNPTQVSYDAATHSWHDVNPSLAAITEPAYNAGSGNYKVAPQDLYTIYNVNKVFSSSGFNDLGASSTVAVIEESDIAYGAVNPATGVATGGDVATFRSRFGVPGTLNMHVYHGYGSVACNAPGIDPNNNGEEVEAVLDAEWANATAPSANLIFMSCDQNVHDGIDSSLMAVIDNNLADVMSMSYGSSELYFTSSTYAFYDTLWTQAAAQGQSVLVSSGDSGSDVKDQNTNGTATSGINVSGLSSSPLITSTGGTDFSDTYDSLKGGLPVSTYWGSTNSAFYGDALSYVPETAWNDSCASSILANYYSYTGASLCATANFTNSDVVGGSGGFSSHYAVPAYQSGILGYSGTNRAQPDIAGFASGGFWGHALIFCDSYRSGYACSSPSTFGAAGGTSFVAPYMAGVTALLDTHTGSRQGLLNPALYALAKTQFTASSTSTACYSNGQTSNIGITTGLPATACTFNDVTTSNNDVPCVSGSASCYVNPGASYGTLSLTGSASLSIAFPSTPGYDEVTGIGTINVYNLLANWNSAFTSSVGLQANPTSIASSTSTSLTATVTGGVPTGYASLAPSVTGTVKFYDGNTLLTTCLLQSGACTVSVNGSLLQPGGNSITATYLGNGTYPSSTSAIQTISVVASQTITFGPISQQTVGTPLTLTATASSGLAVSYSATPSNVCSVSGSTASFSGPGQCSITASQAGNSTYSAATPVTQTFTVVSALTAQTITFGPISQQTVGTPLTLTATASSGLAVSYSATPSNVCSVSGSTASFSGPGQCSITASQAGNSTYSAATPVTQTFTVVSALTAQTITFGPLSQQTVGTPLTLTATASSGLAVSYSATPSNVCSVSGSTASFSGPGQCSITASQAGNSTYSAATPVTQTFTVVSGIITGAPVISNLKAIAVGGNSEVISWTTDQLATSLVNYGPTASYGSSSTPDSTLVNFHSVTLTGLSQGSTYNFDVVSVNSQSIAATSSNSIFVTSPFVGYLAFWGINNSGITISWSTDTAASTFVAYGTTPALGQISPVNSTLTNAHGIVLTGLNSGTTYYFRAESTDGSGNTGASAIASFTTTGSAGSPAPVITNVAVNSITASSALITWTTDVVSTSQVNYGLTSSYTYSSSLDSSLVNSHSVLLAGLSQGTTYNFDVVSKNQSGTSVGTSNNYTFTTTYASLPPATISNVLATPISGTSVQITWTTNQIASSQVNYGLTPTYTSSSTLDNTLVTSHSVTLSGLTPATLYDFDVVSTIAGGPSAASLNGTFTTPASTAVPPYVGYVAYWGVTNSGVTISWSTDVPANTQLAYGTTPALGQLTTLTPALTNSHGVVLTGLNSGTTYYFVAQSTAANQATGYSATFSFTTSGVAATPPVITNIGTINITNSSTVVTWSTDQPSTSQVNYGTTSVYGSSSSLNSTLVTNHSVTLTGLLSGRTYNFDVVSLNASNASSTSPNNTFLTTGPVVTSPVITNVVAGGVTGGSATITWTTDQASSSLVDYGTSTAYGLASAPNPNPLNSHSVTLTGLSPNTLYDFDVVSTNAGNMTSTSANYSFTTSRSSSNAPSSRISLIGAYPAPV